ncbi:ABC transporter ATP-binding protein [Rhodobacterales bacterium]|nr:ABC transporter ATP-binding protein [Rhodobacterales bacterium]
MSFLQLERVSVGFMRYEGIFRQHELGLLEDLSFGVGRGEIVALIGASGGGKSLLAHAIFGILPRNAVVNGTIRIDGSVLDDTHRNRVRGRRMALVPQSLSHLDPMTRCRKQIGWAGQRAGHPLDRRKTEALLARYGLDERAANAFPHELSGGMARRMMIAIATVGDPDLVVADEPTSGLDTEATGGILRHLRSLADAGKAVLLITHSLAEVLPFADRVAVMRGGRLEAIEPSDRFAGAGETLASPYARALWIALPQNAFTPGGAEC